MKRMAHQHDLRTFIAPALFWCVCMLAGCGGTPTRVTQRVDLPVAVPCVKSGDVPARPAYEFDKLPMDASAGAKVLALAIDWPRGRKYEEQLEAVIDGCR